MLTKDLFAFLSKNEYILLYVLAWFLKSSKSFTSNFFCNSFKSDFDDCENKNSPGYHIYIQLKAATAAYAYRNLSAAE